MRRGLDRSTINETSDGSQAALIVTKDLFPTPSPGDCAKLADPTGIFPREIAGEMAAPELDGPQHAPSPTAAHSECEWEAGTGKRVSFGTAQGLGSMLAFSWEPVYPRKALSQHHLRNSTPKSPSRPIA